MEIDLTKCKPGQQLMAKNGKIGIYVGWYNGTYGVYFDADNYVKAYSYCGEFNFSMPNNWDIVEVIVSDIEQILADVTAERDAEIENLRIKADAYDIACDDLEHFQQSRVAAGKAPGTEGSLCDGMAWAYSKIGDLEAELDSLRNQEPVGEWRVHSKNRSGEEFGRFISEQSFEDGQKFYTSPVPQQLEVIESAIFQVDVHVINGEYCITGSQIKKILQEQEFVRLKKEANNKKTEDL